MTDLFTQTQQQQPFPILDPAIPFAQYCPLNLSYDTPELENIAIADPDACQGYIDQVLERNGAKVAYGGYLEKRVLYSISGRFDKGKARDIHLGVDFWCKAGTTVVCPMQGKVHSFANNADHGNYGPTIILEHHYRELKLYTLYGHLSITSLESLYPGKHFSRGDLLATLGTPDINVGYAPHLHFQLILDLGAYKGDYPGVCAEDDIEYYKNNCPDPHLLLGFG